VIEGVWPWVAFNLLVLGLLALDLGVFHRTAHAVGAREAAIWSAIWIGLSLLFCFGIYQVAGPQAGTEWLTGYLIEKSLSVDNIFVFVLIFGAFAVPAIYQHRVLFWGILGALVMRATMILAGAYLLEQFHWIIYLFGALLIVTGVRMAFGGEKEINVETNIAVRVARRLFPITPDYRGARFFVRENRILLATPLFVVLLVVEFTDLIFAVDSIPAIFAVTDDPFIIYTSNVFAILGLRSLYFLLAGVVDRFHLLKYGLAVILVFVGTKMLLADIRPIPIVVSLLFIGTVLVVSVVASLAIPPRHPPADVG
jgi:tellurite resistance protein TerC